MKINSITLKHTNPSLGPHETVTTVFFTVSKEHQEVVDKFLDTAQVNGTVLMREYLSAVINNDTQVLNTVNDNAPKGRLASGQKISTLTFDIDGSQSVALYDVYRQFSVSHFYPDFTQFMVDNGFVDHFNPQDDLFRKNSSDIDKKDLLPPEPPKI